MDLQMCAIEQTHVTALLSCFGTNDSIVRCSVAPSMIMSYKWLLTF